MDRQIDHLLWRDQIVYYSLLGQQSMLLVCHPIYYTSITMQDGNMTIIESFEYGQRINRLLERDQTTCSCVRVVIPAAAGIVTEPAV